MNNEIFIGTDTFISNDIFVNASNHSVKSISTDYESLINDYEKTISRYREIILRRCPEELI